MAGTVSGASFTVSVTVNAGCTISADLANIAFTATAGTAAAPGSVSQNASILCTNGTPYDFHMTTTNGFKMVNGANNIPYTITAAGKLMTTSVPATLSNTGTGVAQSVPFVFAIPAASWSPTNPTGVYSDTVTMNVDF